MKYLCAPVKHFCAATLFLLVIPALSFGQTAISGIINSYWEVISVDFCNNRVALPGIAVGIANGDKVMLIQMTGAETDITDAPTYGTVTDYLEAGNYELLTILDINNNVITFNEALLKIMMHSTERCNWFQCLNTPMQIL
jgi:hypothetical protein